MVSPAQPFLVILVTGDAQLPAEVLALLPEGVLVVSEMLQGMLEAEQRLAACSDLLNEKALALLSAMSPPCPAGGDVPLPWPGRRGDFPFVRKRADQEAQVRAFTNRQLRRGSSAGKCVPAPRGG
ncbi:MAG TPA: hypothetical protein DCW68_05145 [Rhodospirillaceae bacterium]|nr:MAG: hypothetical protein A2018_02500 [Alphaproteobacteria bacterium GWF2_58_20]HAU29482.1 hypothetical protein [Rhodospirillaceae bacterium]